MVSQNNTFFSISAAGRQLATNLILVTPSPFFIGSSSSDGSTYSCLWRRRLITKKEFEEAKLFRIKKCGHDDYQQLKLAFEKYLKSREEKQ